MYNKNDQSSPNQKQGSAPAEKSASSNPPHLANGMKDVDGNNVMLRPQQEELLATDGDDEEKCEEQQASSRLG